MPRALDQAIKINQACETVDLGWNGIGVEGAGSLLSALGLNQTILSLGLSERDIGDRRLLQQIEESLQRNRRVKQVLLNVQVRSMCCGFLSVSVSVSVSLSVSIPVSVSVSLSVAVSLDARSVLTHPR